LRFAVYNLLPAHRTGSVHRIFASETTKAGLAEDVLAGVDLVRLVQQVQTDGTDESVIKLVKFRLGL
jgi:hypothetical protein